MITFFHHLFIGKMEEDTHNDAEGVEPEQSESEHQNETPNPDSTEPTDENAESKTSNDAQPESDSDALSEDTETSHSEETPETDKAQEVEMMSETEDIPEADNTSDSEDTPAEDVTPEVEVMSEIEDEASEIDETPATEEAAPEVEEAPVPIRSYSLGESEELYDFVTMFDESESSGAEHISASMSDISGGVSKPALFEHPFSTEPSRIVYKLDLPAVKENETLLLYFYTGLRDGVIFDDAERQPGGVRFCIEISGEQCFEGVSTECHWTQNGVDLTRFAGNQVELVFITHCNIEGNSSYAWALWGQPQLLKLTRTQDTSTEDQPALRQEIQCGIAIAKYPEYQTAIFDINRDDFTPSQDIANEIYNQLENEPIELTLYASQPKLEIVSVGATAAVVAIGEAFEVQCTIRNVGTGPLPKGNNARLNISEVKLRRGRSTYNLKTLGVGETSTIVWYARSISRPSTINFTVSLT